ncbi:MAG: hypothetical protein AAFP02_21290, partial [Bacteroidota bacterium]
MMHLSSISWLKAVLFIVLFGESLTMQAQAPCELSCEQDTRISLCYESTTEVTPEQVLAPTTPACLQDLIVEVYSADGDSIGHVVDYTYVGQTLDIIVRDTVSGDTCQGSIRVQGDETHPTAVCDEFTVTSLNAETGSAVLCADNFDSGSYDNCFLQSIRIRRMDEEFFKDCIRVDCDDVGTPVMIVLRATDYEGLTDDCMIRLSVDE